MPEIIGILQCRGEPDAIRDCDGIEHFEELTNVGAKGWPGYCTTRTDNTCSGGKSRKVQQCDIVAGFHTACNGCAK